MSMTVCIKCTVKSNSLDITIVKNSLDLCDRLKINICSVNVEVVKSCVIPNSLQSGDFAWARVSRNICVHVELCPRVPEPHWRPPLRLWSASFASIRAFPSQNLCLRQCWCQEEIVSFLLFNKVTSIGWELSFLVFLRLGSKRFSLKFHNIVLALLCCLVFIFDWTKRSG